MDKQKTNFVRRSDAVRALVFRLLAIGLLLYWLFDLVKGYLAGGEDAPSKTLLIIGIVILGGGSILVGVLSVLAWKLDKETAKMSQEEIDLLLRMGSDSQLVEMSSGIIENDRVQVLSGPLKGMEGSIRKIDRHKRMAYLEVEMFGRTVEMKVGLEIVSKKG